MAKQTPTEKQPTKQPDASFTGKLWGIVGPPTAAVILEVDVIDGEVTKVKHSQPDVLAVAQRRIEQDISRACREFNSRRS